jgi:hypothetical protein
MAIAYDTGGSAEGTTVTITISLTIADVANRFAFIAIGDASNPPNMVGVTVGGVAATQFATSISPACIIYTAIGFPAGAQDVVATFASSGLTRCVHVGIFNSVAQSDALGGFQTNDQWAPAGPPYSTSGSTTVTTVTDGIAISYGAISPIAGTLSSATCTIIGVKRSCAWGYSRGLGYRADQAGSTTVGWTCFSSSGAREVLTRSWAMAPYTESAGGRRRSRISTPMYC